ncbi:MAG: peptidoglycan DD-metalloendopeptidase family protein [Tannerellaceae bacterium]|jgi:murein DD-endopeptidase MepM/ murein hydrolase activator NlpD|nr:peptidoglycan DD-metalloendopeptidase family protein [Tannerellaceae bacterium]
MDVKLLLTCCIIFGSVLKAEGQHKGNSVQATILDEHISVLMADRVIKTNVALEKIATLEDDLLREEEDLLFPANELYGDNWDTRWVDPFRADTAYVVFPDSCEINCSSFTIPLHKDELKVTSLYGPRRRRMHRGIDLKLQIGDTVYAAFSGKVRIRNTERRGYGKYLLIRHPNGLETVYGHLSDWLVDVNDIVNAGDPIALGGNTGRSTGSHLHFETRFLGQAINPAEIIDFENKAPHQDLFVFRNIKINGRNSNIYTASENQVVFHRVKSGDTLGAIARQYGTTIGELCRLNGLKTSSTLRVGQSLRCGISSKTPSVKTVEVSATPVYHKIQSGDTLRAIAEKYGTTVSRLCELNDIKKTTVLRLGLSIRCS